MVNVGNRGEEVRELSVLGVMGEGCYDMRFISYRAVKELLDRVWLDIRPLAFTCRCGIESRGPWLHSPSNGFSVFSGPFGSFLVVVTR